MRNFNLSTLARLVVVMGLAGAALLVGCGEGATSNTAPTTLTDSVSATTAGTPLSSLSTTTTPGAEATPTSAAGAPADLSVQEVKNAMEALGMGSSQLIQVYDLKTFGHYGAAYAMAADENVYLLLLNDETGGWVILATYTGLDWEMVRADLAAKGAPADLIEWANPGQE
jgi:hypothetical protein